jgi:hypothetical protein
MSRARVLSSTQLNRGDGKEDANSWEEMCSSIQAGPPSEVQRGPTTSNAVGGGFGDIDGSGAVAQGESVGAAANSVGFCGLNPCRAAKLLLNSGCGVRWRGSSKSRRQLHRPTSRMKTQLHDLGRFEVFFREQRQRFVNDQKIVCRHYRRFDVVTPFDALSMAAALFAFLLAGIVDVDVAHRLRRRGMKVDSVRVTWSIARSDNAQICLMDQRRRIERLAGLFLGNLLHRELPQLVVTNGKG